MRKVKLEDYVNESDYVCVISRHGDTEYVASDMVEDIKEYKKRGYRIYGTVQEEIFDESFIEDDIKSLFEYHADDYGYEDINEAIDYEGEEFKKVKEAAREFIKSLGDTNIKYFPDRSTIIEVEE